jgi:hypothetical protein
MRSQPAAYIGLMAGTLALGAGCQQDAPRHPDSSRAAPVVRAAAPQGVVPPAPPVPSAAAADTDPVPSAAAAPIPSAAAADPTATLTRYLAFASFRGAPAGPDSLVECPPFPPAGEGGSDEGWEPDNYVGIVLPTVLGISPIHEDSTGTWATGRAAVTRVVTIGRDEIGWAGTTMRKRDTLMFMLRRAPAGWAVCGPAFRSLAANDSGFAEFIATYEDAVRTEINGAHWPRGVTLESVARHADSAISAGRR